MRTNLQTLLQSGTTNYLIVGLDDEIYEYMTEKRWNVYRYKVGF